MPRSIDQQVVFITGASVGAAIGPFEQKSWTRNLHTEHLGLHRGRAWALSAAIGPALRD